MSLNNVERKILLSLLKRSKNYQGMTQRNPVVLAAILENNNVLSYGVHKGPGTAHAEVDALQALNGPLNNATLIVTLEPCTHHGQTPPCVESICKAGFKRVIYPILDPNPKVKKNPAKKILEKAGIEVVIASEHESLAKKAHQVYFHTMTTQTPFVSLKSAMSLDGHIALSDGQSKYITGPALLRRVHRLRREVDAIIVGIGTVLQDDPQLTVRHRQLRAGFSQPKIIILDSKGRLPHTSLLAQMASSCDVIQVVSSSCTQKPPPGVTQWCIEMNSYGCDWQELMKKCFKEMISHVLIEGGQTVYSSAIQQHIVDRYVFHYAPKLLPQKGAMSPFELAGIESLSDAITLENIAATTHDDHIEIIAYPRSK